MGLPSCSECIHHDVKCVGLVFECLERRCNILRSADFKDGDFQAKRAGSGLKFVNLKRRVGKAGISDDCQSAEAGDNLTQEFESLAGNIGLLDRQARDIAARSGQTGDEPDTKWIVS